MSAERRLFFASSLALLLTGCLLPQPDTPPIRPVLGRDPNLAAPVQKQQPEAQPGFNAGEATLLPNPDTAGAAGVAPSPAPEMARLIGHLTAQGATAIVLTPDGDEAAALRFALDREGRFETALTPGRYHMSIVWPERSLRLARVLELLPGDTRRLSLSVVGAPPVAEWMEVVGLESPAPSPTSASPAP